MSEQISLNQSDFQQMEKELLDQIMTTSKAMIETFKFKMIYGTKVTAEQKKKTLANLKEFREKNWDKTVSRKEAYEKYANLY